jgi:hypothetical protein
VGKGKQETRRVLPRKNSVGFLASRSGDLYVPLLKKGVVNCSSLMKKSKRIEGEMIQ